MPGYKAWRAECSWISTLSGPLNQALLWAQNTQPYIAALFKKVDTDTKGRRSEAACEDVYLPMQQGAPEAQPLSPELH